MSTLIRAALAIALATLAACGSGGGGGGTVTSAGGTTTITEVPFTSFPAIAPNQSVVLSGTAVTGSAEATAAGSAAITSANINPIHDQQVRFNYDGARALSGIQITAPQAIFDASFDRNAGHSIACSAEKCAAENATRTSTAGFADPHFLDWHYQSFGVWVKDVSLTSSVFGVASVGRVTPGNAVPTSGSANFGGLASGLYIDASGTAFTTWAPVRLGVDFAGRTVNYSTVETQLVNVQTRVPSINPELNLSGSMSYLQGASRFNGRLETSNRQLGGPASGQFYGPAAQEIGGVYSLQGAGVSRMIGAFGGKRCQAC